MSDWDSDAKRYGHYEDDEDEGTVERVVRHGGHTVSVEEVFTPPPVESKVVDPSEVPGMVVVPAFPLGHGHEARLLLEMWEHPGDVTVAVGYSTQAKLVDQLGDSQPWALLTTKQFQGLLQTGKVTALLLDPEPGWVKPRWSKGAVEALARMNEEG